MDRKALFRMNKPELRKAFLERRSILTPSMVSSLSAEITARFFSELSVSSFRAVHVFIRIQRFNEIDTSMIYYRLWREHPEVRTFAPRIELESDEIVAVSFGPEVKLCASKWGIREPIGDGSVSPHEIDLAIIPLLCFDKHGHRVGYGKGYYDRFLSKCRSDCVKAGISLFPPVEVIDDLNINDVPLDLCITPSRTYRFKTR